MALSTTELELQSTEYLPAREVLSAVGYRSGPEQEISPSDGHTVDGGDCNRYEGGILNGLNLQDVATDITARDVQLGLINVLAHDLQDTLDVGTANDDAQAIVSG
jgi:hypothetical protein